MYFKIPSFSIFAIFSPSLTVKFPLYFFVLKLWSSTKGQTWFLSFQLFPESVIVTRCEHNADFHCQFGFYLLFFWFITPSSVQSLFPKDQKTLGGFYFFSSTESFDFASNFNDCIRISNLICSVISQFFCLMFMFVSLLRWMSFFVGRKYFIHILEVLKFTQMQWFCIHFFLFLFI